MSLYEGADLTSDHWSESSEYFSNLSYYSNRKYILRPCWKCGKRTKESDFHKAISIRGNLFSMPSNTCPGCVKSFKKWVNVI